MDNTTESKLIMRNYKKWISSALIILIVLPILIISALLLPDVQKYLIKNQLSPWLSNAEVAYVHITPFAIHIDSLSFSYEAIDISIGQFEAEFSPLSLLEQRIKLERLHADNIKIHDATLPKENSESATLLFPGLFPYLDSSFVLDIGQLQINADYDSTTTGPVTMNVSAQTINETSNEPIKLTLQANKLPDIPDIQGVSIDSSVFLQQHTDRPIDAQNSRINITLTNHLGEQQDIAVQLTMKQLAKPDRWDSFPFDKHRTHYLQELLHPESIMLSVQQRSNNNVLAKIEFNGKYDGNEGIISGNTKILTNKDFSSAFKQLKLPDIESKITAALQYNTRLLQGSINLVDDFTIENYTSLLTADAAPLEAASSQESKSLGTISEKPAAHSSSLPEKITIANRLVASIDEHQLVVNSLLLNIINDDQEVIKILTHKPIAVDLNNVAGFLDQADSELMDIHINQLPLGWLNDFIPQHTFDSGIIDANINLAINRQTVKLSSNRAISLSQINLSEHIKKPAIPANETSELTIHKDKSESESESESEQKNNNISVDTPRTVLKNQNMEADFIVTINKDNLKADVNKLNLFQQNKDIVQQQVSSTLSFNLEKPLHENALDNPHALQMTGSLNTHALLKIPLISDELKKLLNKASTPLKQSLPAALSLNYDISVTGKSSVWTVDRSHIDMTARTTKKQKKQFIVQLKNTQPVQFEKNLQEVKLITTGTLLAGQIHQFDFSWLSPFIQQFASPYEFSGYLNNLDMTLSTAKDNAYQMDVNKLHLSRLESSELQQGKKKTLFKDLSIHASLLTHYTDDVISIRYPSLTIKKSNTHLIKNNGNIRINHPGDQNKQSITVDGKLNASISHLMKLGFVKQFTAHRLSNKSLMDAQYGLTVNSSKLTVKKSKIKILHPESRGQLILTTLKPIALSLSDKKHNFSQNGQLSFKLINFDLKPYESMFPALPISFEHANGHFDLLQSANRQEIRLKQPFSIKNIHFKDKENALLNPFNVILDFAAKQKRNITRGEIKQLSVNFINENDKQNAFDLKAKFKLDLDKKIKLSELNGDVKLIMTQWLNQPAAIPENTLSQGTLISHFVLDEQQQIKHHWLINDLVDKQGNKIVESIAIDGSGKLESLDSVKLTLPVIMKSISGQSNLTLQTHTTLNAEKKKISATIDGETVFLNDLLKLLATINPQSEIAQLEAKDKETDSKETSDSVDPVDVSLDKTPAEKPFWQSGFDINTQLKINTLYYSDYMSYHDITGELIMSDQQLLAKNFHIRFHDSPMDLDARFDFNELQKKPYNIKFDTSLKQFAIGEFLKELNPQHIPRAEGVFDVDINIYGGLSNLSQFRNELLFDINIEGKNGVYHLIPANDVMMRSSGAALAVVGEVVSVLPTSGFGLGIVNRVIRFAKDIHYDFINMHLVRKSDLHTSIETFQILSPELRIFATGGLTFKENTRLFDQPLAMTANMNLAGEGAAIFYGLGLLKNEQDEYGFWKGPVINFSGTLNHQEDNFNEIINKAKSGTLAGGITNPFSGLVGNFKYRWFDEAPDYSNFNTQKSPTEKSIEAGQLNKKPVYQKKPAKQQQPSFFEETF